WQIRGCAGLLYARKRLNTFDQLLEEYEALLRSVIIRSRQTDSHRQDILRLEPRVDPLQAHKPAHQETRADQQDERRSHRSNPQQTPQSMVTRACRATAAFFERLVQIDV